MSPRTSFRASVVALSTGLCLASPLSSQCDYLWQPLGGGLGLSGSTVEALATLTDGSVVACATGFLPEFKRWNGSSWSTFALVDANVGALVRLTNGHLIAGGSFLNIGGVQANRIARWNGVSWSPLGGGIDQSIVSRVHAVVEMPNGDVVIGGWFSTAGGVTANRIARWNGISWSALGSGVDSNVYALTALSNGDLIAGGNFTTAGGSTVNGVARWDGAAWHAMGGGMNGVVASLATLPGDHVVAGGSFTTAGGVAANRVARWHGTGWVPLGAGLSGAVNTIKVVSGGEIVVGGGFTAAGTVPASLVARWTGSHWAPMGSGLDRSPLFGTEVVAELAVTPSGEVVAGGSFTAAAGSPRNHVARFGMGCPSSVSSYGAQCSGSVGPLTLGATTMPVIANSFVLTATGFASPSLGVRMLGTSTASVPLPTIFAIGQAGCELSVAPDMLLDAALPAGGTLALTVPLPNSSALLSATANAQFASFEQSTTGAFVSVVSSNALAFVVGTH